MNSDEFTSSVALTNAAAEERELAQGHARNRIECPSPANSRKRPRTCLAESSGQIMAATRANLEGNASDSCCSVETDAGCDEEDSKLPLVPSTVPISSDPDQEVVPEATTPDDIPAGWARTKLEPDW